MLVSTALAQEVGATAAAGSMGPVSSQIVLIVILVVMFYVLLIMPQQRRFKEHKMMLDALKKGDKVITSGGLVGKIDKLNDAEEVVVDFGNNIKMTVLRHTIQSKVEKDGKGKSGKEEKGKSAKDK